jgi:hypothetical protein
MRIFCRFYAKDQEFVRIRLEERFPNALETVKICMHKLKKSSQDENKRYNFIFYCRNFITPSTN